MGKPCDGESECLGDEDEALCGYNFTYILGLVAFVVLMSICMVEIFLPFLGYLLSEATQEVEEIQMKETTEKEREFQAIGEDQDDHLTTLDTVITLAAFDGRNDEVTAKDSKTIAAEGEIVSSEVIVHRTE